ncbi:MAG: cytochrome c biogenesis protein CcsA [Deltaproteobacteria bacterium]|nr:cytochrome c biogenesis protein CcsA [Deltaproteobacteria bacterium]
MGHIFHSVHGLLVASLMLAVSFLFVFSCVYVRLDHFLKMKVKKPAWMYIFPSLEKMHRHIVYLLYLVFFLLTILVINGFSLAHHAWDSNWIMEPKVIASVSTWVYFFSMLVVRLWKGLRGVHFFIWLIIGCLFLSLSMYGAYAW